MNEYQQYMSNSFEVYFDGGASGKWAYSSYQIRYMGFTKSCIRFKPEPILAKLVKVPLITSNMAEYASLIGALEWLQTVREKHLYPVHIYGDSKLVVCQSFGLWRIRKEHLKPLANRVRALTRDFKSWSIEWRPRKEIFAVFGH